MRDRHVVDSTVLTTVLTSCGRFDLLEETVASFLDHFGTDRLIIAEDSERPEEARAFEARFPAAEVRVNTPKLGQLRSIDAVYATLDTPYVLHLEDDWRFNGAIDLKRIVAFLEAHPDVTVVCIANRIFDPKFEKSARRLHFDTLDYLVWDLDAHPKWFSYSFNPSVARVSLWREIGPFAKFVTEEDLSLFCKRRGMRIAMVTPGIADHIGDDRHAHDPFQPTRAKTFAQRLRRSIAKRWDRAREALRT